MASVTRAAKPCAACLRRLRAVTHPSNFAVATTSRTNLISAAHYSSSSSRISLPSQSQTRAFASSSRHYARALDTKNVKRRKVDMDEFPPERIRNLSIIAHIDHGKSTLADRLLQMTGTVPPSSSPQFLDKLKVERERGITVKAQTVSIIHQHKDGLRYLINLIDTPGHVDFSYEVSRSLGACEGGLLLVDCSQGIQAQTLSVFHHALEADLTLVPVINKVDLPHASPDETSEQIEVSLGLPKHNHMRISAKSGLGVEGVLEQIVDGLPSPRRWETEDGKLRGLIFDTFYDQFRGVVSLVRIFSGTLKKGDKVRFLQAGRKYEILEVGINNPDEVPVDGLKDGQVGYLVCNMKNSEEAFIGDTICWADKPVEPLPGFKPMKAMVYAGVFPMDSSDFPKLEESIERLTLNDRSVSVQRESSAALSQGFRLGFLGTLHMDVFRQRLEDEYSSEVIVTAPTVPYKVVYLDGKETFISNPVEFPEVNDSKMKVSHVEEPMINATIFVPNEYIGDMMDLCARYRGVQQEYRVLEGTDRAILRYSLPLSEIVTDFFSELKSSSSGFASFDYEEAGYEQSDLVKMNILINGKPIDALAMIVHRNAAQSIGKTWVKKLKEVLPRQQFVLSIQAAIGARVVARENLNAFRKDVTAGLYGGHYERKLKHLNKQKEGKKRLKSLAGNIAIPQSAFYQVLSSRPRSFSTSAWSAGLATPITDSMSALSPILFRANHMSTMLTNTSLPFATSATYTTSTDPVTDHLPADHVSTPLVPTDQAPRNPSPIAQHTVPPHDRSSMLSSIARLTSNPPPANSTSSQLHENYTELYERSPSSHLFSSGELNEILSALKRLQDREKGDRRSAQDQLVSVIEELKVLSGDKSKESALRGLEMMILTSETLQNRNVKAKDILRAEKTFKSLFPTKPTSFADSHAMKRYRSGINHLMYLCAMAGHEMRFGDWSDRLEREGLENDSYTWLNKMILFEKINRVEEIPSILKEAFENTSKERTKNKVVLINFVLWAFCRLGRWDIVIPAYTKLRNSSLDDTNQSYDLNLIRTDYTKSKKYIEEILIPKDVRAIRQTYTPLLHNLAAEGDLTGSLTILQHIFIDGYVPTVKDYVVLFKAFTKYGEVHTESGEIVEGDCGALFSSTVSVESGSEIGSEGRRESLEERLGEIWAQGALSVSPPKVISSAASNTNRRIEGEGRGWTIDVLEDLFESFLSLNPTSGSGSGRGRAKGPNRKAVYIILKAFAKTTNCNEEIIKHAWERMELKFGEREGKEGWEGWKEDGRLKWLRIRLFGSI